MILVATLPAAGACQNGIDRETAAVTHLDNLDREEVTCRLKRIRYPGVGKVFLFWSVIGALTIAGSQLMFTPSRAGQEAFDILLSCVTWYLPWALRRDVALATGLSAPFCAAASAVAGPVRCSLL